MKNQIQNLSQLTEYQQRNVRDGYAWECACGEMYRSPFRAVRCRKCRTYLPSGVKRHALNIVTGEKLGTLDFNLRGDRVR